MAHDDVKPLDARRELRDLGQLVVQMLTESVRDLDVPSGDDDLHRCPPWDSAVRVGGCLRPWQLAAPPPAEGENTPQDGPCSLSATPVVRRPQGGLGAPCMNASPHRARTALWASGVLSPPVRRANRP